MPILIAHRGNFSGKQPTRENTLDYILDAIQEGYDVEVDVWCTAEGFFLGHDQPCYHIHTQQLMEISKHCWFHAKNFTALQELLKLKVRVFSHDVDDFTITSNGFIWTYPGRELGSLSIACMPELCAEWDIPDHVYGICSDNLLSYSNDM